MADETQNSLNVLTNLEARLRELELAFAAIRGKRRSGWITNLLQGVTLVAIIGFAFWFGTLNGKVEQSANKLETLSDAISSSSKDSLASRLSTVEAMLNSIYQRLESIDNRLSPPNENKRSLPNVEGTGIDVPLSPSR